MTRHQFGALVVLFGALACGGGGERPASGASTSVATPPPAGSTGAAPAAGAAGTAAAQPVTGKVWDVKMYGDTRGYRYDPASLTIKRGDGVRWTVVSGLPHNVTFWPDSIPSGAASALQANMPTTMAPLTGPLLVTPSQTYSISFAGVPAGTYHYYCTPHLALGMKGTLIIQ